MDILICSSSLSNAQQSNSSIRIQTLRTNLRSNSLHLRNIKGIIKDCQKTHTRRKSCYCTECGCLGKFQFENMNTRKELCNNQKGQVGNTESTLILTLTKQDVFFQRKRTTKKTDRIKTIIESSTTGDKIDEQKTQYFNFNLQSKSSLLYNIIGKREQQIKQINKISRPQCLNKLEQRMRCLIPMTQKHIQLPILTQCCCSRIKTENQSYHNQPQSPSNRTISKSNYKNSPYYQTYGSILTPQVKFRNNRKK
ncbi:unnamed protein product [Paramecium primaurelia]|uniref:Uncharacterized protein n=1 Tax=Paramecium primaurelia TaxID=5886 RepID=A0A8S1Q8Y2_PARPR|nr:unnamed protein product [Paramecium primaurelia]CAD8111825.1 unnamed protein product [Paramecium primaurelia]